MGARRPLIIVGAVLMIISIFFPTVFAVFSGSYGGTEYAGPIYYWLFGQKYAWVYEESDDVYGGYYTMKLTQHTDLLGIICMLIIIVGAILAIALGNASDSKAAAIGGGMGLVGMALFYLGVLLGLSITHLAGLSNAGVMFYPFVGFAVCMLGGTLALVGGTLDRY